VTAIWPGDSPRARTTDRLTSHEAADATAPHIAASQAAVRHVLSSAPLAGAIPLTDVEIARYAAELGYRFSDSRLRTARRELEDMGIVESAGTVKPSGSRTRFTVWKLAEG
jgi:hypothetical protein